MAVPFPRILPKRNGTANTVYDRIVFVCLWLIVFLVPLFFLPFSTDTLEYNKALLFYLLVLVAGVAWLMKIVVRREGAFVRTPFDVPIAIIVLLSLLAALFSQYRFRSFIGTSGYVSNSFVALIFFVFFFFLVVNTVRREQLTKLFHALLLSGAVLILFNFFQVFSFFLLPWDLTKVASYNGLVNSPSTFSVYLAIIVILAAYRFLGALRKIERHPLEVGLYGLLGLVGFFLLFVYDQPYGWIALIIGLCLFLIFLTAFSKHYPAVYLVLPTVLIGVSLIALFVNTQSLLRANLPGDVLLPQSYGWQVASSSVRANPLVGFGQGTYQAIFAKFRPMEFNDSSLWNLRFLKSSNEWFQLLSTVGVLGTLGFLFVVVLYVWKAFRSVVKTPIEDPAWWQRLSLLAPGVALVLTTFFMPMNFMLWLFLWLFLGLGVVGWREKDPATQVKTPRGSGTSFAASLGFSLVVILGFVFVYFAGRFWIADMKIARANISITSQEDLGKVRQLFADSISLNQYEQETYFDLAQNLLVQAQLNAQKEDADVNELRNLITASVAAGQSGAAIFPAYSGSSEALASLYQDIDTLTATTSEETKKAFTRAIELEPNNPQLSSNLGQYLFVVAQLKTQQASAKGEGGAPDEQLSQEANTALTEAQKAFEDASGKKANYVEAKLNIALALRLLGKKDEAVKMLEEMASANPFQVDTLFNLAENYLIDNRTDDAEAVLNRIVSIFPGHSDAHFRLAQIFEDRGEKEKAVSELETVSRLNPDNTEVKDKIKELKGIQ